MSRIYLVSALALIFLLGISAAVLVYKASQRVAQSNQELVERAASDIEAITWFQSDLAEYERLAYELYGAIDADRLGTILQDQARHVEAQIPGLSGRGLSGPDQETLATHWSSMVAKADVLIENIDRPFPDRDAARDQLRAITDHRQQIAPIVDDLKVATRRRARAADQRNQFELKLMSSLVTAYTVIILLIATAVAWVVWRMFLVSRANRALAQFPARNPLPVVTIDRAGKVCYANQAAFDFSTREISGTDRIDAIVSRDVPELLRDALDKGRKHGQMERPVAERLLSYHWYWLTDQEIFHVYIRDITNERAAFEKIERMAYEDEVTGLMNRTALVRHLDEQLADRQRLYLVLLSIDRYHLLPSSVGFHASDRILAQFARDLESLARHLIDEGVALARIEGAVFALSWSGIECADQRDTRLSSFMQSLPSFVRSGRLVFRTRFQVGVKDSVGESDLDGERILSDADAALRAAERTAGPRCVIHDATIRESEQETLALEERLHRALTGDDNGLQLHMQPQVDLRSGAVVGAEILLRWHDDMFGQVPPGRFIPAAEQSGLIVGLGRWVSARAVKILSDWQDDPVFGQLRLAVNAAPEELRDVTFASRILELLAQAGVAPDRLEIEVTERVLADTAGINSSDCLGQLRRAGVQLSIDDFGTGYSSLAYLATMPVTAIKIDKCFIDQLPPSNRSSLAQIIVNLARELQLHCIAEGVETQAQADYLREIGCKGAQGYLFAQPMNREAFEAFIAREVRVA